MKNILLFFATFVSCISIHAQQSSFGIKGGVNITNVRLKPGGNAGAKIAYHAGMFSHIPFSDKWAFEPEVIYSRQGSRQTLSNSNYDFSFVYTNVPLLIQLTIYKSFRVEAGPQIGFLLSAKNIYNGIEKDVKSNYKTIDISFPIGASYLYRYWWGIDARWVPGLSELQQGYGSSANNVFQIGVFYQLNKNKKK